MELVIVLVIALVVLGPKRLPDAGKAVGKGMREFKDSITGKDGGDDADEKPPAIEASQAAAAPAPPAPEAQPAAQEPTGNEQAQAAFGASGDATPGEGR